MGIKGRQGKNRNPAPLVAPADLADATEALATQNPDEVFVHSAGLAVVQFLRGVTAFFATATTIERNAEGVLALAEQMQKKPPTNVAEDIIVQDFVRMTTADKKAAEEHWKITATISQFHRRMTGARARATDKLETANAIGNRLHNAYVETERARAAAEQDRLRREAEEKARADQQAEQARAAAEALRIEQEAPELSPRENVFVDTLLLTGDAFKAASKADYAQPRSTAEKLLALPKIIAAIEARRKAEDVRRQAAAKAAIPLDVQHETVRPNIGRAAGASDRTTHSAELVDERALVDAVIRGGLGIPSDLLVVDEAKLNEYARSLHELVNRWPGVRYKKTTKVV